MGEKKTSRGSRSRTHPGRKGEDNDVIPKDSNFKLQASNEKDHAEEWGPIDLLGQDQTRTDGLGCVNSGRPNTKKGLNFKLGEKKRVAETEEGSEEVDSAGEARGRIQLPKRSTIPETEVEMLSKAESSSSRGSLLDGGARRQ